MEEILTLIGNYVFPVAMCILVWYQSTKNQDKMIDKVTELIQANTQAMTANAKALEDLRETIERKVD